MDDYRYIAMIRGKRRRIVKNLVMMTIMMMTRTTTNT